MSIHWHCPRPGCNVIGVTPTPPLEPLRCAVCGTAMQRNWPATTDSGWNVPANDPDAREEFWQDLGRP